MNPSTKYLPAETDRITRAIFEYVSLIGREPQLEEVPFIVRQQRNSPVKSLPAALCAHVDAWTAGAEQYDDMTVVGLRVRG